MCDPRHPSYGEYFEFSKPSFNFHIVGDLRIFTKKPLTEPQITMPQVEIASVYFDSYEGDYYWASFTFWHDLKYAKSM